MGATAADTQREIDEIRKDISSAAEELVKRAGRVTDLGAYTRSAKDNPAALAVAGLVVVGVGGLVTYRAVAERRRQQRPQERLKRTVRSAAEELGERFERARGALPFDVRVGSRDDDDDDDRGSTLEVEGSEPSMIKRVLWAALVASVMAGAGLLARRVSAAVWKAAMKEDPPTANV